MDFATYQNLIEQNKHLNDDSILARFYDRAVKTGQFDHNGMPLFKTVCYCEIRIKDNTTEIFDQPASEEKIKRFPVEYARYQLSKKQTEDGTPLEQFAFLSVSEIESCKYRGVYTVEALAGLEDKHAQDLNLMSECELARKFIAANRNVKQSVDLKQQENDYQQEIDALKAEIAELKKTKTRRKIK